MAQYVITRGCVEAIQDGDTPPTGTKQYYKSISVARDALKAMIKKDVCKIDYGGQIFTIAEVRFLKPVLFSTDLDWFMFCACTRPDFRQKRSLPAYIAHYQKRLEDNRVTCRDLYVAYKTLQGINNFAAPYIALADAWDLARTLRDEREDASTNRAGIRDMLHARRLYGYIQEHIRDDEFFFILEDAPCRTPIKFQRANVVLLDHKKMLRSLYDSYERGYDCAGAMELIDNYLAQPMPYTENVSPIEACTTIFTQDCAQTCKQCVTQVGKKRKRQKVSVYV